MADYSRLEELRRRLETDPASIAFAQLAEEYRRAGLFERAVDVSRQGLAIHPGYASARVTLGRALLRLGRLDEARAELQGVLESAPENLAAVRGLAEIHLRHGELTEAISQYETALTLAPNDPEIEQTIIDLSTALLKSRNTMDRELAARQLAAMEQWLLAVHVTRVQRHS